MREIGAPLALCPARQTAAATRERPTDPRCVRTVSRQRQAAKSLPLYAKPHERDQANRTPGSRAGIRFATVSRVMAWTCFASRFVPIACIRGQVSFTLFG